MFDPLQFPEHWAGLLTFVDDPAHKLLKNLLATDDPVEFDALSLQLRSMLHERIEHLRNEAKSLKPKLNLVERKKRPRDGTKKP
jgi:hypothetical protein